MNGPYAHGLPQEVENVALEKPHFGPQGVQDSLRGQEGGVPAVYQVTVLWLQLRAHVPGVDVAAALVAEVNCAPARKQSE